MRHTLATFTLVLLTLSPGVMQGQDRTAPPHRPMHKSQGFIDYALGKVNPDDKDYGASADAVRNAAVEYSVDDLYFWSNVVALALLAGVTTVLLFHLRSADKREVIAASLIAQLWNGRVSDRVEIERHSEQYNDLVQQHNAEVERALTAKPHSASSEGQTASELKRSVERLEKKAVTGTVMPSADAVPIPENSPAGYVGAESDTSRLQQRNVLLENRVEALKNTEQNLKERLNQTISLLEEERNRNRALKGA